MVFHSINNVIISEIISTWRMETFKMQLSSSKWSDYIYVTIAEATDYLTCAVFCAMDENCDYSVFSGGCHLGDFSTVESILQSSAQIYMYFKRGIFETSILKSYAKFFTVIFFRWNSY